MKFLFHMAVLSLLSCLLQSFLPWWTMVISVFVTGLFFQQDGFKSFLAGFLGISVLWFAMAYSIDMSTDSILSSRVARLFPTQSVGLLMLVTSVIGGLVGGFASMTAGLITHKRKNKY